MGETHFTDSSSKGVSQNMSASQTSSFEALDPHDPNLSRLATTMFEKTSDFLHGELTSVCDSYVLFTQMNQAATKQMLLLRQYASDLKNTLELQNQHYVNTIKPYLLQVDTIETNVAKLEQAAYKLDQYTFTLKNKLADLEKR